MRQRVDRLEVGVEYEPEFTGRVAFAQVMGPSASHWYGMTADGQVFSFPLYAMPHLAAPEPATPAPTWEWRQVQEGDWFLDIAGHVLHYSWCYPEVVGQYGWVAVLPQVTP